MNKKLRILITVIVILAIAIITIGQIANSEVESQLNNLKLDLESKGFNLTWDKAQFKVIGTDLIIEDVHFYKDDIININARKVVIDMIDLQNDIPQFLSVDILDVSSPKLLNSRSFNIKLSYEATDDLVFNLKNLELESPDLFNTKINGIFNNVLLDNNFITNFNSTAQDATIKEFNIHYSDNGMINEVIKSLMQVEDGDLYRNLISAQISSLSFFSSSEELRDIFTSLSEYIKNPETISINSQPESDVSLYSLLNITTPIEYLERLNLTIK